mmetsp:Transcript_37309/g.99262  ORF Transcript_37309/g.99262 Transcript_37309/m.99262 type:complete len:119 (-) Transcript_37309:70-426(-)
MFMMGLYPSVQKMGPQEQSSFRRNCILLRVDGLLQWLSFGISFAADVLVEVLMTTTSNDTLTAERFDLPPSFRLPPSRKNCVGTCAPRSLNGPSKRVCCTRGADPRGCSARVLLYELC